jgi:uncharacterized membrane protein
MRTRRATLLVLVTLGLLLRLAFLAQPMRVDEAANYEILASRPLGELTTHYIPNNHPLATLLVHLATSLFGDAPWAIRLPALVAGVLVVPATYLVGRVLFDRGAGLVAAALAASSSPLVEYATCARGYSLQTLFVLALFYAAARTLEADDRRWWVCFVLASILGFYTLPTTAFFFAGVVAWLVASAARRGASVPARGYGARLAVACGAVGIGVALVYLPFVLGSGLAAVAANPTTKALTWTELGSGLPGSLVSYVASWHRGLPRAAAAAMGVCFVASLVVYGRVARFRIHPAPVLAATSIAMVIAMRVIAPERVWVPFAPLYFVFVAAGAQWLASRALGAWVRRLSSGVAELARAAGVVLVGVAAAAMVLASNAPYQTDDQVTFSDAEPLAEVLGGILREGDIVYVHLDAYYALAYYFERHGVPTKHLFAPWKTYASVARAFVIDASRDYAPFTYREAMNGSNLARTKAYDVLPVADLPHATLLRILDPELAPTGRTRQAP